ncbi:hypothetical protein M1563_04625 [Patescibacteria group bacterium]|nr:hypothetical protein [Patescibacteria group bacterium]MCL5409315.1 hypothetical protein [Patescibacteria group bacterium]
MTEGLEGKESGVRGIILTTREGHTLTASAGPLASLLTEHHQTTQKLGRFKCSLERFDQWYVSLTISERALKTSIYDKGREKIIGVIQATANKRSETRRQLRGRNWLKA